MKTIEPKFQASAPAVGLLVLKSDEAMESELRAWLPSDISLHHARVSNANTIDEGSLAAMLAQLPVSAAQLPEAPDYRVIAYGCTSGAMVIGSNRVRDAIQTVFAGVAVTDPFTALKNRLDSLSARRIGLLVPYEAAVAQGIVSGLQNAGFEIVEAATFNENRDDRVCRIAPESVLEGLLTVGRANAVDAVVGSCTNLRAIDVLNQASTQLGKPVLTSNSALAWHIQSLCAV